MRFTKQKSVRVLAIALVCLAGMVAAKLAWNQANIRALRKYDARPPLNVVLQSSEQKKGYILEEFTFEGSPGERVPVMTAIPSNGGQPCPAIIFLYGIGMKIQFVDKVAEAVTQAGFALFVPEQFNRGKRRPKGLSPVEEVMTFHHRIMTTIHDPRRLIDVIEKRPDIDSRRIYLWGASFGAMAGCSVMAYDPRLKAGILTLGGGDFQKMARDSSIRKTLPRFSWIKLAAPVAASLLRPFDPILHIARIAPRPLLFQNLHNDEMIPRSSVEALYNRAGQPKQIIWYDSPHNHPLMDVVKQAVLDGLTWLKTLDRELVSSTRFTGVP
ncbi:MAG: dienelactone hydrolase family protein [Kiritimatiellaeota bacterium]|nr:dienelactone hydrolase family protein [Kiritimatiellota bacterium]